MGVDGSQITEVIVTALTTVEPEVSAATPAPQAQTTADERPAQHAQEATLEHTGADPPPPAASSDDETNHAARWR